MVTDKVPKHFFHNNNVQEHDSFFNDDVSTPSGNFPYHAHSHVVLMYRDDRMHRVLLVFALLFSDWTDRTCCTSPFD